MTDVGKDVETAGLTAKRTEPGDRRGWRMRQPSFTQILHSKGFGGGVPLNTETAAVNPRAGIE